MHVFTVYTPTHRPLLEQVFLPSLREHEPDLPVTIVELQQRSIGGTIKSEGVLDPQFADTLREKYETLWDFASSLPYGELILCSDCDIQFFKPFAANLESYMDRHDILHQTSEVNPPKLNIGFVCFRWIPATRAVISTMLNSMGNFNTEETAINFLMRQYGLGARSLLLPPNDYWSVHSTPTRQFHPDTVPPDMYMHHGNGGMGTEKKLKFMQDVRDAVLARQAVTA